METFLGILAGITAALAPLMWATYEYLKLKNRTLLWDKLKEWQHEKNTVNAKIDSLRADSCELIGLHEYRRGIELIIADISARLSLSSKGDGDTDPKGNIQPSV